MKHEDKKDIAQHRVRARVRRKSVNWRAQWASQLSKLKVKEQEDEGKKNLSPLISISDSYRLSSAELVVGEQDQSPSSPLVEEKGVGSRLHSKISKISSKITKVVPKKHRRWSTHSAAEFDIDAATASLSPAKSKNIFHVSAAHSHLPEVQAGVASPSGTANGGKFDLCEEDFEDDAELNDKEDSDGENEESITHTDEYSNRSNVEAVAETELIQKGTREKPPNRKLNVPILRSYRRRAWLEQAIAAVPKDNEVVEVGSAIIYKPKVTIVTENAMSLNAGAELLTLSLGKTSDAGVDDSEVHIEELVKPTNRKIDAATTIATASLTTEELGKRSRGGKCQIYLLPNI